MTSRKAALIQEIASILGCDVDEVRRMDLLSNEVLESLCKVFRRAMSKRK